MATENLDAFAMMGKLAEKFGSSIAPNPEGIVYVDAAFANINVWPYFGDWTIHAKPAVMARQPAPVTNVYKIIAGKNADKTKISLGSDTVASLAALGITVVEIDSVGPQGEKGDRGDQGPAGNSPLRWIGYISQTEQDAPVLIPETTNMTHPPTTQRMGVGLYRLLSADFVAGKVLIHPWGFNVLIPFYDFNDNPSGELLGFIAFITFGNGVLNFQTYQATPKDGDGYLINADGIIDGGWHFELELLP